MTIEDLLKNNNISVRSYNICIDNGIDTVNELNVYLKKRLSFRFLQNCGEKSNQELIEICRLYSLDFSKGNFEVNNTENKLSKLIPHLSRIQREVINSCILINTNSLSIRSKNAILSYLKNNLKVKNFIEGFYLTENFSVNKMKHIGAKSIPEIEIYLDVIEDFIKEVAEIQNEQKLYRLKNKFLIQKTFAINSVPNEILESESIFKLISFIINSKLLYDKTQTFIIENGLKLYENTQVFSKEELAIELNLSNERVRQIRKICLDELFFRLEFIQNFNDDLYQKYNIDFNSNYLELNKESVLLINSINKTNFTKEFISIIIYVYLKDYFSLIGNIEDILHPKTIKSRNSRVRHNWNNFYLIKKEIISEMDFNALATDIEIRINDKIEETYSFNFKSYLSKFLINDNIDILDFVFPIAEIILNEEFQLFLDLDENVTFKRTTVKQIPEYIVDALESFGEPASLSNIYNWIEEKYPNLTKSEDALRGSCQRSSQIIYFGRSSTYGLKKWENSRENIKGGTIRQIVEEFLSNQNLPQHKKEITKYVKQFRPKTNSHSIYNNLYIDESNTFVFYENYFIGLSVKNYPNNFNILSKTKPSLNITWEENLENLKQFINNKKRLPHSSGCPESEKKIYRWFSVQKRKCYDGNLENNKVKLITELNDEFSIINDENSTKSIFEYKRIKRTKTKKYSLTLLINFIKVREKIPDSRMFEEKNLYQFYYRTKKNIEMLKTFSSEELEFLQLIEKYNSPKRNPNYSINSLINFFEENERIPNVRDENDLYQYYHRQKSRLLTLNEYSTEDLKLKNLIDKYKSTSIRVVHNIQELINFISRNKRLPYSNDVNESKLYQFYFRKKRLFEQNKLNKIEEIQFIEVTKLL